MKQHEQTVGVIGLGRMGSGMAANLIKAGYSVCGFDISDSVRRAVSKIGIQVEASVGAVAQRSTTMVLSLYGGASVESVLLGEEGILATKGKQLRCIIDTTTIAPDESRRFAEESSRAGVGYLDAPVTGGEGGARAGTLFYMVGGDQSVYQECLPLFETMGQRSTLVGPSGSGGVAKMVNQLFMCAQLAGAAEACTYVARHGADMGRVLEAINPREAANQWLQAVNNRIQEHQNNESEPPAARDDHYTPVFVKDMDCVLQGSPQMRVTEAARDMLKAAVESGADGPFPYSFVSGLAALRGAVPVA